MEIAIRAMLVMVIALVVGVALLTFSKDILNQSRDNLEAIDAQDRENSMLRVNDMDASEVAYLMEECMSDAEEIRKRETCFAVRIDGSGSSPAPVDIQNSWQGMGYDWSDVTHSDYTGGQDSIFIYAMDAGNIEIIDE